MRFVHEFERRPLSRLRRQLPLRRGANGMRHKFSPHYWEAAILRFCRHFRHRADAKLSPYPWGAKRPGFRRCFAAGFTQNFHRTHGVRQAHGFLRIFDTGLTQRTYRYGVRAPPKKPPLCKGRRVGFSRAGGLVFSVANCRTYGYGNYRCPVSKQRNTPYCFAFRLCGADLQRTPIAISHRLSAIYSLRFTQMFRTGPPQ